MPADLSLDFASTFSVPGNFTQPASGRLDTTLAGHHAGNRIRQLVVTGTASLDGTLGIGLGNNFLPSGGGELRRSSPRARGRARFRRSSAFDLDNGLILRADYHAQDVTLSTVSVPGNHPPVPVDDTVTTDEDTPVTVAVLANDSDPDGDPLACRPVTQPAHGTVVINADNTVTYSPARDFHGTDSFTYTARDGKAAEEPPPSR